VSSLDRDDPDVRLMLRVRDGDEAAFEELVRRKARFMINFAYRFVGSRPQAEDLAQEAFLKILQAAPRYQPTARLDTWLMTIVVNLCRNWQRRDRMRRHVSLDAPVVEGSGDARIAALEAGARPASEGLERDERARSVRAALESLPRNQRLAVILLRWENLSYAEIADVLDVTPKAVKSLLNRARANLRERLAREGMET